MALTISSKRIFFYALLFLIPVFVSLALISLSYLWVKANYVAASEYWICYTCPSSEFTWRGSIGAPREFEAKITTNKLGFNDKEFSFRSDAKNRLLILGDSFVEAMQVNSTDSFGSLLEKKFEDTRVYKIARSGWGQKDILDYLEFKNIKSISPNKAVIAFFYHNDLWNNDERLRDHLLGDATAEQARPQPLLAKAIWRENDFLAYIAYYFDLFNRVYYRRNNDVNTQWTIYQQGFLTDPILIGAINKTRQSFENLKAYLNKNYNIKNEDIYVLIIPTSYHMNSISGQDLNLPSDIPKRNYHYKAFHQAMREFTSDVFGKNNVIDLVEHIDCNGSSEGKYYTFDSHWNSAGHKTVACALENIIIKTQNTSYNN